MSALLFYKHKCERACDRDLPNNDDDKIQHIPAVSHIGVLVHHQSISDDLEEGFNRENDQEGIFYRFL